MIESQKRQVNQKPEKSGEKIPSHFIKFYQSNPSFWIVVNKKLTNINFPKRPH